MTELDEIEDEMLCEKREKKKSTYLSLHEFLSLTEDLGEGS